MKPLKRKTLSNVYLSPAKLNLFFRVLHKREDGYHEIASLYQAIDLFDRLFISPSQKDLFSTTSPSLPLDENNLVLKALSLFRRHHPIGNVTIHLEKNIPMEAGLAGGSSNAATTLWALNELFGASLTLEELIKMGSQLGSDVPFFFSSGTAYCTGRGEIVSPFSLREKLSGYLAVPSFGVKTPSVYREMKPKLLKKRDPRLSLQNYPEFFNDLETASFSLELRLKDVKQKLEELFETVVMTGSGSTFFCLKGKPQKMGNIQFIPFCSTQKEAGWYSHL